MAVLACLILIFQTTMPSKSTTIYPINLSSTFKSSKSIITSRKSVTENENDTITQPCQYDNGRVIRWTQGGRSYETYASIIGEGTLYVRNMIQAK